MTNCIVCEASSAAHDLYTCLCDTGPYCGKDLTAHQEHCQKVKQLGGLY